MEPEMSELIMQVIAGLILMAIAGGMTSMFVLYKCIHRQGQDMKIMKKATAFVLRRQVQETKTLHPEKTDEIEDLEKTYKDLISDLK